MPGKAKMRQASDAVPPGPPDDQQRLRDELATAKSTIKTQETALIAAGDNLKQRNVIDRTRSVELALQFYAGKDSAEPAQLVGTAQDIYNYIHS